MTDTKLKFIWKTFKELSSDELYAIIHLRQKVFIVEQDCPYIDADYTDQNAFHLLAYEDNELIGYLRDFKPGIKYEGSSLGRIVTEINSRGLGVGKEITKEVSILHASQPYGALPLPPPQRRTWRLATKRLKKGV